MTTKCGPAESFFLKLGQGQRFCLFHAPPDDTEYRGSVLYVHPFAEEMNKARRMAALQARSLASAGYGVLQIDLLGCGDSTGDFADARWELWKTDLALACDWLEQRAERPISLWALRLGALLSLDFAAESKRCFDKLVLWQPVVNGASYLTRFLRMRLASEMLAGGQENNVGTQELRAMMSIGKTIEVGGYELAPALAASIDRMNAADLAPTAAPVHWLEVIADFGRPMPPATARITNAWEKRGVNLHCHLVPGATFWSSQEITECPALLAATTAIFSEAHP